MAWYYDYKNSDLYGSNFSTVLADAPPPLDDTEEEDNDIVFRSQGKKSKLQSDQTIPPVLKKIHSSSRSISSGDEFDVDITSKSQIVGKPGGQADDLDEESDFGDFAGFADFGSAFGQDNSEQAATQTWFNSEENGAVPCQAGNVNTAIEETKMSKRPGDYDDGPDVSESDGNQEKLSNGKSDERDLSIRPSSNQNTLQSNDLTGCSTYEVESDEDFGSFTSVASNPGSPDLLSSKQNGVEKTKDLRNTGVSASEKGTVEAHLDSDGINEKSDGNHDQCNFGKPSASDKKSVDQPVETLVVHDMEKSRVHVASNVTKDEKCITSINSSLKEDEGFDGFAGFSSETSGDSGKVTPSGRESWSGTSDHGNDANCLENLAQGVSNGKNDAVCASHKKEEVLESDSKDVRTNVAACGNGTEGILTNTYNKSGNTSLRGEISEQSVTKETTAMQTDTGKNCEKENRVTVHAENQSAINNDAESCGFSAFETQLENTKLGSMSDKLDDCDSSNSLENHLETGMTVEGNEDHDDSFGEFADFAGSPDENTAKIQAQQTCTDFHGNKELSDVSTVDSQATVQWTGNEEDDKSNSHSKASFSESTKDDNDSGDFGAFDSQPKQSTEEENSEDGFGDFGVSSSNAEDTPKVDQKNDEFGDFGDFGAFDSHPKHLSQEEKSDDGFGDFGTSSSKAEDTAKKDQKNDEFGDFGAFDSQPKHLSEEGKSDDGFGDFGTSSSKAEDTARTDQRDDDFGDFGHFDSQARHSFEQEDGNDDFGDFGAFDSQLKSSPKEDQNNDKVGAFASFESNIKDSQKENQSEDGFGDFGAFDSSAKSDDDGFGNFRTSTSDTEHPIKQHQGTDKFGGFDAFSSNVQRPGIGGQNDDDFGSFSSERVTDSSGGLADFSSLPNSGGLESSASENISTKQHTIASDRSKTANVLTNKRGSTEMKLKPQQPKTLDKEGTEWLFTPGGSVIIAQAVKPVSLCFSAPGAATKQDHSCKCDVLLTIVGRNVSSSNLGVWQHLESSDKGDKVKFSWSSSFSKHNKLLSLNVTAGIPPLQVGSILKPNMPAFGAGLGPGSMLMPQPKSKVSHFTPAMGLLEPVKGSAESVPHSIQDKTPSQHSFHPELALPDLSFILGAGLKRTASKSDLKDNVSDTTSESSSLDLDFFVPVTSVPPADGKTDSRGLYEEDLMGLNIMSPSEEPQRTDSPKIQKATDAKKVWQHGGLSIPLTSQERKTKLSSSAKQFIDQLEDLRFMNSSVLMFPLKSE